MENKDDRFDLEPILNFLKSEEGRKSLNEVLEHLNLRKTKNASNERLSLMLKNGIAGIAVTGACLLAYSGQLDGPSTGVILSGALGYILGNHSH